jgi:hypothetical protein
VMYKFSNCLNMCRQKILGENCSFQEEYLGPKYFDNLPYLKSNECYQSASDNFSSSSFYLESCNCPLECRTVKISHSITLRDYNYKTKYETNYLSVFIYYSELKETVMREYPKYLVQDLIANFGGQLGVFLGASFLSFVEILELMIEISIIIYSKLKRKTLENEPDTNFFLRLVFVSIPKRLKKLGNCFKNTESIVVETTETVSSNAPSQINRSEESVSNLESQPSFQHEILILRKEIEKIKLRLPKNINNL